MYVCISGCLYVCLYVCLHHVDVYAVVRSWHQWSTALALHWTQIIPSHCMSSFDSSFGSSSFHLYSSTAFQKKISCLSPLLCLLFSLRTYLVFTLWLQSLTANDCNLETVSDLPVMKYVIMEIHLMSYCRCICSDLVLCGHILIFSQHVSL